MKPRDIADTLAGKLRALPDIATASRWRAPGFLNMSFVPAFWQRVVAAILKDGRRLRPRRTRRAASASTSSTCRPIRPARCMSAIAAAPCSATRCANLLAFAGYDVTREYYINDAGAQVDALARSAFLRYREALGEDIGEIPAGLYPGDYLKPVGEALATEHGHALLNYPGGAVAAAGARDRHCRDAGEIKEDLAALNIRHDVFFSERSLTPGKDQVRRRRSRSCAARAWSSRGGSRSPRVTTTRSGRTASRRCSGPPPSATTSTAR